MAEDYEFELPEREVIIEELLKACQVYHEDEELDEFIKQEFSSVNGG
jgi:hypothetical protein